MEANADVTANVNTVCVNWSVTFNKSATVEPATTFVGSLCENGSSAEGKPLVQRHTLDASSCSADGVLRVQRTSEFHFLLPGKKYSFALRLEGQPEGKPLLQLETVTSKTAQGDPRQMAMLARALPLEMWRTYVGEEHELGQWLAESPEDTVWATTPSSYSLMHSLWLNACFTLPSPSSPLMQCPNPISRYCLDLTKGASWLRSKKVKRHKNDFYLTVNAQYLKTFNQVERSHTENGKGTWITPELVSALDRCRKENGAIKVYSIELWDKASDKLAAAIMALSVGDIFHDYTTCTFLRDDRSAGSVLTKVTGHLLAECGFTLWYWGFKNPYMAEYDARYGGIQLDNKEHFWPRWRQARLGMDSEGQPRPVPRSLADLVLSKVDAGSGDNGKLDLACLS